MTDDTFDPWKSLASELGVDASKEPAPPPPPSPPTAPAPRATVPASTPPAPKKASSDWMALAGELGIEVPSEPPTTPTRRDPVAELLGFPPPAPRAPHSPHDRDRGNESEGREKKFRDDDVTQDRWTADEDEGSIREIEESAEIARFESVGDSKEPRTGDHDSDRRPPQRRRGRRGGRGRGERPEGRSDDRTRGRSGGPRDDRPVDSGHRTPRDVDRPAIDRDEIADVDEAAGSRTETGDVGARRPGDDEPPQKRRRRRGRRGRGGSRERSGEPRTETSRPPSNERDDNRSPSEALSAEEEIDFVELIDDDRTPLAPVGVTADVDDDVEEELNSNADLHGDAELHSDAEFHGGKSSVRDIVTWKEAIGMIIEGNLQARSRAPQGAQGQHGGSHGQHGSRGRGGRGRGRGGGHRGG